MPTPPTIQKPRWDLSHTIVAALMSAAFVVLFTLPDAKTTTRTLTAFDVYRLYPTFHWTSTYFLFMVGVIGVGAVALWLSLRFERLAAHQAWIWFIGVLGLFWFKIAQQNFLRAHRVIVDIREHALGGALTFFILMFIILVVIVRAWIMKTAAHALRAESRLEPLLAKKQILYRADVYPNFSFLKYFKNDAPFPLAATSDTLYIGTEPPLIIPFASMNALLFTWKNPIIRIARANGETTTLVANQNDANDTFAIYQKLAELRLAAQGKIVTDKDREAIAAAATSRARIVLDALLTVLSAALIIGSLSYLLWRAAHAGSWRAGMTYLITTIFQN